MAICNAIKWEKLIVSFITYLYVEFSCTSFINKLQTKTKPSLNMYALSTIAF